MNNDACLRAIVRFFHKFVRKASTRGPAIYGRLTIVMNHSMNTPLPWAEHFDHRLR